MHDDCTHEAHAHMELITGDNVPAVPARKPEPSKQPVTRVIEIIAFKPMSGGTFAHIDDVVSCFTFEAMDQFGVGDTITAQGEFIGGAQSGVYQLRSLARQ